jgi:hypothetical protein
MRKTQPADYDYKRYRIAQPACLPVTTVSLDRLTDIRLAARAGGPKKLSAIVRATAARIRVENYQGTLSAEVLREVERLLG